MRAALGTALALGLCPWLYFAWLGLLAIFTHGMSKFSFYLLIPLIILLGVPFAFHQLKYTAAAALALTMIVWLALVPYVYFYTGGM